MNTVLLEGMDFFAYHGFYEEERKIGNKYTVDVAIETDFNKAAHSDELSGTVNYELVYAIVKTEMAVPSKLLENIAERIISKFQQNFASVKSCQVSISKHNPPLGGICTKAKITLKRDF